ncbi:MAG: hypothetical protein ABJA62_12310 [Luteimonas sp.]
MKIAAVAVLSLCLPAAAYGAEPAFARTCIKATQTEKGRMTEVSVAETSGHKEVDAFARNLVKVFRVQLSKNQTVPRQQGFVVVDYFEDGSFASTLFKEKGRLVHGCSELQPLENGFGT